jgi:hypothetical protein
MTLIYCQQLSQLTFCSSLSKDRLSDGSGVATILSCLKSTHAFKQDLSFRLEWIILIIDLLILPSTMGLMAVTWVLSSWKTEWSSQAPCFKLFDLLLFRSFCKIFQIKLRDSYVWPSQVSPLWYFWILTKTLMVYAFSLLSRYVVFLIFRHSNIMPSLSHPTSNKLIWSS